MQRRVPAGLHRGGAIVGELRVVDVALGCPLWMEGAACHLLGPTIRVQHDLARLRRSNSRGDGSTIRRSQNKNLRTDWGAVVKIGNVIVG